MNNCGDGDLVGISASGLSMSETMLRAGLCSAPLAVISDKLLELEVASELSVGLPICGYSSNGI